MPVNQFLLLAKSLLRPTAYKFSKNPLGSELRLPLSMIASLALKFSSHRDNVLKEAAANHPIQLGDVYTIGKEAAC